MRTQGDTNHDASVGDTLTREDLLRRAAGVGLSAAALSAMLTQGDAAAATSGSDTITFSSWGGAYSRTWKQTITDPFTRATGIKVKFDDAPGQHVARLLTQRRANHVTWDVLEPFYLDAVELFKKQALLLMPASLKRTLTKASLPGQVFDFGISTGLGAAQVIVANKDALPKYPVTPAQFFDTTAFPGRRGAWHDGYVDNVISALLADGVPKSKLFPLDLDRAYRKLDTLKDHIDVWWTSGDQQQQIMRDKEVDMEWGWDGRAFNLKKEGNLNLNISFDGGPIYGNILTVPQGAPNPTAALKFIEFYGTFARGQAKWTEQTGYAAPNRRVNQLVKPSLRPQLWTWPPNRRVSVVLDVNKIARLEDPDELKSRWYDWLQG